MYADLLHGLQCDPYYCTSVVQYTPPRIRRVANATEIGQRSRLQGSRWGISGYVPSVN